MRAGTQETLSHAHSIASEYDGNLTLRQLYYQLVARGFIPNSFQSYQRIVGILTDARLSGDFPFEWLIDRTREALPGKFTHDQSNVPNALNNAAGELRRAPESWLWRDRWYGQPVHVSVWVEKEALAGVFEEPCESLGVASFTLRGYSSLSALSQWVDNTSEAYERGRDWIEEAVVLYFGDHDPDGWEIPRSAERNIEAIANIRNIDLPPVRFERIALLLPQIKQFNPPPFPAKETSSRYESYIREHGIRTAWELDALRPDVLQRLIRDAVGKYFDEEIHNLNNDDVDVARAEMRKAMRKRGWINSVLGEAAP